MRMRRAEEPLWGGPEKKRTGGRLYQPVALDRIAPAMALAAITGEDNNFLEHDGIDYAAIRKALGYRRRDFDWDDPRDRADLQRALSRAWERRAALRGASTITQQLAKNLYLSPSRTPLRKLRELWLARRLEAALSKRRILELYLNVVEWGDGIYGAEAASRAYFRKPASALSASEASLLAGALVNPRLLTPARPTRRLLRRQRIILARMGAQTPPARVSLEDEARSEDNDPAETPPENGVQPPPAPAAEPPPTPAPPPPSAGSAAEFNVRVARADKAHVEGLAGRVQLDTSSSGRI